MNKAITGFEVRVNIKCGPKTKPEVKVSIGGDPYKEMTFKSGKKNKEKIADEVKRMVQAYLNAANSNVAFHRLADPPKVKGVVTNAGIFDENSVLPLKE